MALLARYSNSLRLVLLTELLFAFSSVATAAGLNPLRPADTSSPRATLQGFVETVDEIYRDMKDLINSYTASNRLYFSPEERGFQMSIIPKGFKAAQSLDTSHILPVLRDTVTIERVIQLKEILDRIELPPYDDIPDQEAMKRASSKRWRLPDTEIDIVLIESGPRAGGYLVSADTVDRLPEFYERVRKLPYKPGPAKQLADAYRIVTGNRASTIYQDFSSSPAGLAAIVPPRWMLGLPVWAKAPIAGIAVWQWVGFVFGFLSGMFFLFGVYRLSGRLGLRREDQEGPGWHSLLTPLAIIFLAGLLGPLLSKILRISGSPLVVITFAETIALFLSAAWLSVIGASLLAETIVSSEHLRSRSLDSQLIRLGMRLAGIAIAIGFLIQGSYDLGFPAYSVLAGLGVGGLAVALAARDSLANLLGSMLIMFEKPFRVGHVVRVAGGEGTVEDVGFRSTRIRTLDNSLISIPNNAVVNATVENLSLRVRRRQRLLIQVTYDTSREKLEELVAGIKRLIVDHPLTNKINFNVRFNDFGESSLNVLVYFYIETTDYSAELEAREQILLQIMELAKQLGINFAFPTRTLVIENPSEPGVGLSQAPVSTVRDRRSAE